MVRLVGSLGWGLGFLALFGYDGFAVVIFPPVSSLARLFIAGCTLRGCRGSLDSPLRAGVKLT